MAKLTKEQMQKMIDEAKELFPIDAKTASGATYHESIDSLLQPYLSLDGYGNTQRFSHDLRLFKRVAWDKGFV